MFRMRPWAVLGVFLSRVVSAQILVDENRAVQILRQLNPQSVSPLQCELTPVAPAMTFTFRFQAGYLTRVPLKQFRGPGHRITVLTRVTPERSENRRAYFLRTFDLPDIPDTDFSAELAGAFLVGDGHYQANAVVFDESHRVCRADWQIEAKGADRFPVRITADSVAPISDAASWTPTTDAPVERMTVFLHAAPLMPRSLKLQASDVVMAQASLMALLEQLPARSVRLVVFNLNQGRELFRSDFFSVNELDQVTRVLDGVQLELTHYQNLQQPRELLSKLIHREVNEASRANDVIFLGPDSDGRQDLSSMAEAPSAGQRFFYLQYRMAMSWSGEKQTAPKTIENEPRPKPPCQVVGLMGCTGAALPATAPPPLDGPRPDSLTRAEPDAIATVMHKLKGKVFVVRNPKDFASAVERIERR